MCTQQSFYRKGRDERKVNPGNRVIWRRQNLYRGFTRMIADQKIGKSYFTAKDAKG